jgi:putative DNA primase/helicase
MISVEQQALATCATFGLDYIRRDWRIIPVPFQQKGPRFRGWNQLRITQEMVASHFPAQSNIGVILGPASNGLVDVDLDCAEALAISDGVLPKTGSVFGRASKPRSHRFYYVDGPAPSMRLTDPISGETLVELRGGKQDGSAGLQTIVPPSIHPSGERIEWTEDSAPARVDYAALKRAVLSIAVQALLERYCPSATTNAEVSAALAKVDPRIRSQVERWQAEAKAAQPARSSSAQVANNETQPPNMPPAWDSQQHRALKAVVTQRIAQSATNELRRLTLTEDDVRWVWTILTFVDSSSYEMWFKGGGAVHDIATWPEQLRWEMWCRWASEFDRSEPKKIDQKIKQSDQWLSYGRPYDGERATIGTIHHYAKEAGWDGQTLKPLPDEFRRLLPPPASTTGTTGASADEPDPARAIELKRLAGLPLFNYVFERDAAAKKLKIGVGFLDKLVNAERRDGADERQGQPFKLIEREPWHEQVNGYELVTNLKADVQRYVTMADSDALVTALWIIHTYLFELFVITPRLSISSPELECGKSLLLDVLDHLVNRPYTMINPTAAVLFRLIDKFRPTVLCDEVDKLFGRYGQEEDAKAIVAVLNSGHRAGGQVPRCVGDKHLDVRSFRTFAPAALAGIGNLDPTLASRCVHIKMKRRLLGDPFENFRPDRTEHLQQRARQAQRWCDDNRLSLNLDPVMPDGVFNRNADNWRPLLAIADATRWGGELRIIIPRSVAASAGERTSLGAMLLTDIKSRFDELRTDFLPTEELVTHLRYFREDRPWRELRYGKGIDSHWVAQTLAAYRIKPEQIRLADGRRVRGYLGAQFKDAFARYLTPDREQTCEGAADLADQLPHHLRGSRRRLGADAIAGM